MTVDRLPSDSQPTRVRYLVVGLCMAMSVLLYLDRFALSPATDAILRELALSKEQLGRALFTFFFAYALAQVPAGWLSDTLGARATLALYVVAWSLATMALGLVQGLVGIALVRLLLGITQAGAYPAAASLLKRWIPYAGRGRANTSVSMGGRAGALLAFFCTPILMVAIGHWLGRSTGQWRIVFVLYGLLGLVWAVVFWLLYRDSPREHPWCNAAEAELIEEQAVPASANQRRLGLPWLAMLKSPEIWLMCLAGFTVNIGWVFLVSWLPQYLIETYGDYVTQHIGEKQVVAGVMTAMTGLGGMCGGLLGGTATDFLVRAYGRKWGRRLPGVCGGLLVLGLYLSAALAGNIWLFLTIMIAISFTIDFSLGATWASYQDIGGRHVASVLGVGNMVGNFGAAIFTWLIGLLAEHDQWRTVFLISGGAMILYAGCWSLIDVTRPVVRE